jgi:type 1 glutamine amidotransferase
MPSRLLTLAALAALAAPAVAADPPKKVLLIGSPPDDHARTTHEYMPGVEIVAKLLKPVPGVEATVVKADGPWKDGPDLLSRADCVLIFLTEGAKWVSADPKRLAAFRQLAARGGGLACLHWGMGTREAEPIEAFVNLFGGCHGGPDRKHKVIESVAVSVPDPSHPVAAGLTGLTVREEFYYQLKFAKTGTLKPILRAAIDGNEETVAWAWERPDVGRSFGFSGLHFHDNWKHPTFRRVVAQGVLWAAKVPVPKEGLPVDLAEADLRLPAGK